MVIFIIVSFTSVIVISQKYYLIPTDGLRAPDSRHVYVITYSKADISKFPLRQDFAEALVLAFSKDNNVIQWLYIMRNTHRILRQQVNVVNGYKRIISLISLYYIYCIV